MRPVVFGGSQQFSFLVRFDDAPVGRRHIFDSLQIERAFENRQTWCPDNALDAFDEIDAGEYGNGSGWNLSP